MVALAQYVGEDLMRTAKEYLDSLPGAILTNDDIVGGVYIDDIIDRDTEVLEEAARLTCYTCELWGLGTLEHNDDGWWHILVLEGKTLRRDCTARHTHDYIAELKKGLKDGGREKTRNTAVTTGR